MTAAGLPLMKSGVVQATDAKPKTVALFRGPELGMKPHSLRVGDGAGDPQPRLHFAYDDNRHRAVPLPTSAACCC